jgi:hypothetical protein
VALVAFAKFLLREVPAMPKAKQLTVSCENSPGTLADIAGMLGKAKINILAFNASSAGAMGYIQFVVDNASKARKLLEKRGMSCYEEMVLRVTLPNVPGALGGFARKLAAKDINIGAGYQTTEGTKKATVVLAVSRLERASRVR